MPFFKKSVTFTGPNDDIRADNVTTTWDESAFSSDGGPVQVTYTNYVFTTSSSFYGDF